MTKKILQKRGFTLIEGLVVLGILGVLIGSLYVIFKSGLDSWKKAESRFEIFQNARAALEIMSREISGAIINPPANTIYFYATNSPSGFRTDSAGPEVYFVAPINQGDETRSDLCEIGYWLKDGKKVNPNILKRYYVTDDRESLLSELDFDYEAPQSASGNIYEHRAGIPDPSDDLIMNVWINPLCAVGAYGAADLGLMFQYYDGTNWINTWDSRTGEANAGKLPVAVKITLITREPVSEDPQVKTFETIVYLKNSSRY